LTVSASGSLSLHHPPPNIINHRTAQFLVMINHVTTAKHEQAETAEPRPRTFNCTRQGRTALRAGSVRYYYSNMWLCGNQLCYESLSALSGYLLDGMHDDA
jgi:hypothetical protein